MIQAPSSETQPEAMEGEQGRVQMSCGESHGRPWKQRMEMLSPPLWPGPTRVIHLTRHPGKYKTEMECHEYSIISAAPTDEPKRWRTMWTDDSLKRRVASGFGRSNPFPFKPGFGVATLPVDVAGGIFK